MYITYDDYNSKWLQITLLIENVRDGKYRNFKGEGTKKTIGRGRQKTLDIS